ARWLWHKSVWEKGKLVLPGICATEPNKIDPSMIHQDPQDYRAIYLTSPLKIEELEHAAVNLDTDTMHNHLNSNTSFNTQH
ncbi:hypothetical protein PWG14_26425, partial [Chromobacterium amazonense]|uniref:hypothetical protein n=1 Tax=Chromobacterium amazonense TaxID=1382803 RepID=UPI00237E384D